MTSHPIVRTTAPAKAAGSTSGLVEKRAKPSRATTKPTKLLTHALPPSSPETALVFAPYPFPHDGSPFSIPWPAILYTSDIINSLGLRQHETPGHNIVQ